MRILSRTDVQQAITMAEAIEAVAEAFAQLSSGRATVPLRTAIELDRHAGTTLFMPSYLADDDALGTKIVSVHSQNPTHGLPLIHALVVLIEAATGRPLAAMEGGYLTALRTGAGTGVATRLLARPDAHVVACFGAGRQAETQVEAVCTVRDIHRVWVVSRRRETAEAFARRMADRVAAELLPAESPAQAVRTADIVITATTSTTPVFDGHDLQPGTHINAIGAYTPEMQEVDAVTVQRATIVVDQREACLAEAGDLVIPLKQGLIGGPETWTELGEIILGKRPGRTRAEEITYFKSVGNAVQDVAVAQRVLAAAEARGLGVEVACL